MSATSGLRCPECGREARREREFARTRRRWRWAAAGMLCLLLGAGAALAPAARSGAWHRWLPNTAVIALPGRVHDKWVYDELHRRVENSPSFNPAHGPNPLWEWQWRMLTHRCGAASRDEDDPVLRREALALMLLDCPDPQIEVGSIIGALGDAAPRNRHLALWGAKACRYELAGHRAELLEALEGLSEDLDPDINRDLPYALAMFRGLPDEKLTPRARFGAPSRITPDDVVARLRGAKSDSLVKLHRELGIWPRLLLWPYNDESGPYVVERFDLELDGLPGVDCAIRVGDQWSTHCEFLVFTSDGPAWRFRGAIDAGNNQTGPPTARAECTPSGKPFLVISQTNGYAYQRVESWFRISRGPVEECLARVAGISAHDVRPYPTSGPVIAEIESRSSLLDTDGGGVTAEIHVHARFRAARHPFWSKDSGPVVEQAGVLFERQGVIRYRLGSGGTFQPDPASPWTEKDFDELRDDQRERILHRYNADLTQLARAGTEPQRAWLRLFLEMCDDTDDRRHVEDQLPSKSPSP
jgi:hypothetical protein